MVWGPSEAVTVVELGLGSGSCSLDGRTSEMTLLDVLTLDVSMLSEIAFSELATTVVYIHRHTHTYTHGPIVTPTPQPPSQPVSHQAALLQSSKILRAHGCLAWVQDCRRSSDNESHPYDIADADRLVVQGPNLFLGAATVLSRPNPCRLGHPTELRTPRCDAANVSACVIAALRCPTFSVDGKNRKTSARSRNHCAVVDGCCIVASPSSGNRRNMI